MYGYTGNILEVDLTNDSLHILNSEQKDLRNFIGGFGTNCKYATDYIKPKLDPLSEENTVIIGAGPLVGTPTPGSSRIVAITKFPATGAIANSCGSMSFGYHLKHSGFDHIIIKGVSENPCYIVIQNDDIQIKDAKNLWGKDIVDTTDKIKAIYGTCGVISIGQAGENLVKGALTLVDKISTFGRGGLGAVLGSKNLKAIVAKGNKGVNIYNRKEFFKILKNLLTRVKSYPQRSSWIDLGMLRSLPIGMILSLKGQKKKARQASEKTYLTKIKKRRIACPSCPMADKDILQIKEGEFSGEICYTSSVINPFFLLALDGITTYQEAIKAFALINRYGLDSLTITAMLEFLSKMNKEGLLPSSETGYDWKTDFASLQRLIEIYTFKPNHFSKVISNGWNSLAQEKGGLKNKMLTVKGLDVIFDPRLLRLGTMEFEQVVNPKGAHVASGGSPTYVGAASSLEKFETHFRRMGIPESAFERIFSPPKKQMGINVGRLTRYAEDWYTILSSQGVCARAQMNRFYSLELITELYNVVTGFDFSQDQIRIAAERSWNLLKLLNVKEGFSKSNDKFPKGWFEDLSIGKLNLKLKDFFGEVIITEEIANQLLNDYYEERGWSTTEGTPLNSKIRELGLEKKV